MKTILVAQADQWRLDSKAALSDRTSGVAIGSLVGRVTGHGRFTAVEEPFRVAVISNACWGKHQPQAKNHFDIAIHTITKPFHLMVASQTSA
jgi:hypothetical protein